MDFINNLKLNVNQKNYILEINDIIFKKFPPDLYEHTIGTLKWALKLAQNYLLNKNKSYLDDLNNIKDINVNYYSDDDKLSEFYYKLCICALLHDYGKIFNLNELKEILLKFKSEIDATEEDLKIDCILHGFAGAFIVKKEFNINDEIILNVIKYHTTGYFNMNILDKIIYISDKIEENRIYKEVYYLRQLSLKNINLCLLEVYKNNIIYIIKNNKKIYSNTCKIWNNICELYGG